ncbi:NAD-dependent epimerase/dehydratase family protein [Thiocapsa roseopersicina]|uniref:Nucleoside-diphosphate-sugar epimerase n=1 Tax=Thiocapsa roseopersicina TaxID=1058 RepID=A0A1H3BCV8_THIRO|nr:NAD-dependent epimerase/dehydratase family protein [Thiocapsa roseopersicina]SDX39746.1 Nucleoside-diphosphate-sugar epimerase [Thiocapsa roseopersicina]
MDRDTSTPLGSILVTGATGKVGRRLVAELLRTGHRVAIVTRSSDVAQTLWPGPGPEIRAADLTNPSSLGSVCDGIDTLFHLASYSPRPDEPDIYEAPSHWPVTAEGTANLMARVAQSGIRRVVYLSSIKAMGDRAGALGRPADESIGPTPDSLYGRAKLAAERSVLELGRATGRHAAVLRLPMVYGLGDSGNIARMVKAVAARRFPPWPRIENHRAAIHVEDAVAAAILVAGRPETAGEVYLVTDGRDYSTRWLYEQSLIALGRPVPRWTVPLPVLRLAAGIGTLGERLTRRRMPLTLDGLGKLTGDAWFSSAKLERALGFRPRLTLESEIPRLVETMRHRNL